jgi:choline dehydrogenase
MSKLSRRAFGRQLLAGVTAGCAALPGQHPNPAGPVTCPPASRDAEAFDYVVVGSGAGGGPLAANLARAGYRVLLLEAGGQDEPYTYQVPAYHALATEDPRMRWDFFVRHYADEARQRKDPKYVAQRGVYYPRASTLGGCTAHNAMITISPHARDWDRIAELTGDASWRSDAMWKYFQRIERCQYLARPRDPDDAGANPGRHGFAGWLPTSLPDPTIALRDRQLVKIVAGAAGAAFDEAKAEGRLVGDLQRKLLLTGFDPNDARTVGSGAEGVYLVPLATEGGRRVGTREYLRRVQAACPGNLVVRTGALVTRVLFDGEQRAIGVEYLRGERLYRADREARPDPPATIETVRVAREVVLAAGAFNTPQLLKLSGVGPRPELARLGIDTRVDLPGVGENLQDRYEVGVVLEMAEPFSLLEGARFEEPANGRDPDDPLFREWRAGRGAYTTNGAVIAIVTRSSDAQPVPDLILFGLAGRFAGYYPGYSKAVTEDRRSFTWAILKAHTRNTAGQVTLRTADPRDPPNVNFRYFEEGNDANGEDLAAVAAGVEYVRRITRKVGPRVRREVFPGPDVRTPAEVEEFVRANAWGHHACGSCKMGPATDPLAVVDSRFRVHGTKGLRVVDASVFPAIPGFFIVTPIYMISEKATDVLLADATGRAT